MAQVAKTWWTASPSGQTDARKRLQHLIEAGYLARARLNVHPVLELEHPLFRWSPGRADPDAAALARLTKGRWRKCVRATTLYYATRKAAIRFAGCGGKIKRGFQATHDLHVSEVFLIFRRRPGEGEAWLGEDQLASLLRGAKIPDAVLMDAQEHPRLVVEFGGAYPSARIAEFHDDCRANGWSYELW